MLIVYKYETITDFPVLFLENLLKTIKAKWKGGMKIGGQQFIFNLFVLSDLLISTI